MNADTASLLPPGALVKNLETGEHGVVMRAEDWFSDWIRIRWSVSGVVEDLPFCALECIQPVRNGNGHHGIPK